MNARLLQIQQAFKEIGITSLVPGFYDDPAFLEVEQQHPTLLDLYAEYCVLAAAEESSEEIRKRIIRLVSFLSSLIAAQPGDGRCLPTTLLVQRFLDAEEVWNFPQKGGIVVNFPTGSKLDPKVLEPIDSEGNTYGHAWNVAPPFIVDLTISRQFYSLTEQGYISGDVLVDEVAMAPISPFSEDPSKTIQRLFPPFSVALAQCSISYYPYATGGPSESFVDMKQPVLDGLTPFELFQRFRRWKEDRSV